MLSFLKHLLSDIRFWLIISFIVRLAYITQPPLEVAHNWRQTTVCMVARNFAEDDADIRFPRIDIAGEKSGITGMEFPLLNYSMFIISEVFGYASWYGRLINLIITTFGIYFFYLIVRRFFDEKLAFIAAILLHSSLWFMYGRKIMPDTFAASLLIVGLWSGIQFMYYQKRNLTKTLLYLFFYLLFISVGLLSKLPAGALLAPLLLIFFDKKINSKYKIILSITTVLCILPVIWWYFIWSPFLRNTFENLHFFMGSSISEGFKELISDPLGLLSQFYDVPLKFSGCAAFLLGLYYLIRKKEKKITFILAFTFLAFIVVMLKGGNTFIRHSYYMVPFVPVMALVAAYGISKFPWYKLIPYIVLIICIENIANQIQDFHIKEVDKPLLELETTMDRFSKPTDLVAVNSVVVPTPMYFAHRKGWVANNQQLADLGYRHDIKMKGCKLVIVLKKTFGTFVDLPLQKLEDTPDWTIYRLN